MTIVGLSKYVATVGGALLVAWQLANQFDAAMQKHLTETFATKGDFQRLEEKLDKLTDAVSHRPAPSKK